MPLFDDQLAQIPQHPPRSLSSLPGLRFSAVISRSALAFPLIFIVIFTLFPLSMFAIDPKMKLAMGSTRNVQGRVLSVGNVSACGGSGARRIVYTFPVEPSRELRGAATICEESPYSGLKEGDTVEVEFAASEPSISRLRGEGRKGDPPLFIFGFIPIFMLAMFSPLFVPQVRELLRVRRLFRDGQLTTGTVIFVKKRVGTSWPGWPNNNANEVFVTFQSSSGELREATAWCPNEWLLQHIAPGTAVRIAYRDKGSSRIALLAAFLR